MFFGFFGCPLSFLDFLGRIKNSLGNVWMLLVSLVKIMIFSRVFWVL